MSEKQQPIVERRNKTAELIDHMLTERNQLLSLLVQASKLKPTEQDPDLLNEFCQVLVDYIAAGHFGLYQRILDGKERRKNVSKLALQIYPRIEAVTEQALAFNEKYDLSKGAVDLQDIHRELSSLGEELTARIELEDKLINRMLGTKSEVRA